MPLFKGLSSKSTPKKAIDYITRGDKAVYVSVRNLFEDEDYAEQFADTMKQFGKGKKFDERKYYHFKLSCARKDNVSPEQAHLYAQELAAVLFQDDECVIATHTDTKTVHSHIIVNAVNPITGKKLRITESNYTKMKDEANRLGSEFGYTPTDFRKKAKNKRTNEEQHIILKGGTSWKEDLREVIEEAKQITTTQEEFIAHLKLYGVEVTRSKTEYSFLHPETKSISVNEEEAEIVRYIFRRYIEGAGGGIISRELRNLGYKTKRGGISWPESTIIGIIKNEKYKGDLLMGKTFTVDPITKRRLENMGEEDQFYISGHHEPIVSVETFEKAQALLRRRSQPRIINGNGKREKFSRKYSFSCLIKCGFCGGTYTRRNWHSGTTHSKRIWQCVTATKGGRKFCPDSKGIEESQIEKAFVESYQLLCSDNKNVVDEFLTRVEQSLSDDNVIKQIDKIKREISALENKKTKLVDMRLEEIIEKSDYELKYQDISAKIELAQKQLAELQEADSVRLNVKKRLADFKKALDENKVLTEFDRAVFESVVDHVLIGGYDEDGNKDPEMISFVYKTGFKDSLDSGKFRTPRKVRVVPSKDGSGEPCSLAVTDSEQLCSIPSQDARGDYCSAFPQNSLRLPHLFLRYIIQ